jgi:hypothetical protein
MQEGVRRCRQLKHPLNLAVAIGGEGTLRYHRREPRAALELAEAEIALSEEHGIGDRLVAARSLRGWAMTELGQPDRGIDELEEVAAAAVVGIFKIRASEALVRAYIQVRKEDRALAMIDESLARIERTGSRVELAELYRLRAKRFAARLLCRCAGRKVLSRGDRNRAQAVGKVVGAARDGEPRRAASRHQSPQGGARGARGNLQLVHRGL